jgi:hypothetical protein
MPAALDSSLGDSLGSVIFGTGSGGVGLGGGILGTGSGGVGLGSGPQGSGAGAQGGTAAVVLTVQNLNDKGAGSLRQAILDADSTGESGQDTITFTPGLTGSIYLLSALPDLQGTIDLEGPGAGQVIVQRSAAPDFGIFNVPGGATVTVAGLTIANGKASSGGGISSGGNLTVKNCVITGNTATDLEGGGIFSNAGSLTVTNSTVSDNSAAFEGGGIFGNAGSLTVTNSTVSGNGAATAGAGIFNGATQADITNSTIAGNRMAVNGAGLYNNSGSALTLVNSTVAGDTAANVGGGIAVEFLAVPSHQPGQHHHIRVRHPHHGRHEPQPPVTVIPSLPPAVYSWDLLDLFGNGTAAASWAPLGKPAVETVFIDPSLTAGEKAGVLRAMTAINSLGTGILLLETSSQEGASIAVDVSAAVPPADLAWTQPGIVSAPVVTLPDGEQLYRMTHAVVQVNSHWSQWWTGASPAADFTGLVDFQTVMEHELGHAIGLGHDSGTYPGTNADGHSPMFPGTEFGVIRRQFSPNDVGELNLLYGGSPAV